MKIITLLHPFSAKAIGLNEVDLYNLHSKPHENALRALQNEGYKMRIDYFTGGLIPFYKNINNKTEGVRLISRDDQGTIWVFFRDGEIYYQPKTSNTFHYFSKGRSNVIRCVLIDNQNIWIALHLFRTAPAETMCGKLQN